MPVRRATGQSLRGYSTSMKSTEQVPDAHRGSSLVLHYVTKVWSDVPRGRARASNRTQAVKRLHPDHTLAGRPEQRHGSGARRRGGPGHNPGGLLGPSGRKKLTACYRHGRIDPHQLRKFANEGNPGKCSDVEMLLRTPGSRTRVKVAAAYG